MLPLSDDPPVSRSRWRASRVHLGSSSSCCCGVEIYLTSPLCHMRGGPEVYEEASPAAVW